MSRYIDADELIRDISETYCKWCKASGRDYLGAKCKSCQLDDAIIEVERVAAESIDIVRCKECKHCDKFPTWSACTYWSGDPYEQASVNADDFCSYGERKESE